MGRKKKISQGFLDKNAPKTGVIQIRVNSAERTDIEKLRFKLGISRSEVIRNAVKRYAEDVFGEIEDE